MSTPNAEVIGKAIYEAEDPHPGVAWERLPPSFRKMYTRHGERVETALYSQRVSPSAPLHLLSPSLAQEIRTWAKWWQAGGAEKQRPTRKAVSILLDVARILR